MDSRPNGSLVVILTSALSACAGAPEVQRDRATTLAQAREDYLAGLTALKKADYPTARERLQKVARGPSYIAYTPLARLRLADALMLEEKYEEAAEAYRSFTKTALGDPNLHYAYFRLAEATVRSMPAEFFLLPPADRKDQKPVRAAIKALGDFLTRFPDSPFVLEARQMLDRMVRIAGSFEMEVARFYRTRNRPQAAVRRLARLVRDVPEAGRLEEVRAALVEALAEAGDTQALQAECERYRERFPTGRRKVLDLCQAATPPAAAPSDGLEAGPPASDNALDTRR